MSSGKISLLKIGFAGILALFLAVTPLSLTSGGVLVPNEACGADENCVPEQGSVCTGDGQYLLDYRLERT